METTLASANRRLLLTHRWAGSWGAVAAALLLGFTAKPSRADQVEMKNGDRYSGQVLLVSTNTVVLRSEWLGTVKLPRAQVISVIVGASTNAVRTTATTLSTATGNPAAPAAALASQPANPLKGLGDNPKLIQQVQAQILGDADPAATAKFQETINGLMNGTISVADIRAQAKSAADQLRAAKKDLGNDSGFALDGYLAILDKFVNETAGETAPLGASTNSPATKPGKPAASDSDE